VLMGMSVAVRTFGQWMLLALLAWFMAFLLMLGHEKRRISFNRRLLHLPLIGRIARGLNTARYSRTLIILIASAVPLLQAMRIRGDVISNDNSRHRLSLAT
ncbi:type II secretion system protein GspF, partial [Pectobacterium brasiliense]|nr:type II secretion system protein GspF [Pectobacterium brasiliense]